MKCMGDLLSDFFWPTPAPQAAAAAIWPDKPVSFLAMGAVLRGYDISFRMHKASGGLTGLAEDLLAQV
jgi:hypothetical protein